MHALTGDIHDKARHRLPTYVPGQSEELLYQHRAKFKGVIASCRLLSLSRKDVLLVVVREILEHIWDGYPVVFVKVIWDMCPQELLYRKMADAVIDFVGCVFSKEACP